MKRVKDLAIMHSCIGFPEDKEAAYERYERLVDLEFRTDMKKLIDQYKYTGDQVKMLAMKRKIGELNRRLLEARKVWEQYALCDEKGHYK